jgi:hypothetical protein
MVQGISAFMVIGLIVASVLAGVGAGFIASQNGGFGGIGSTVTQTGANGQNSSSPYVLSMVITTGNTFNSTIGDQPAFYLLGPNGLVSSADITLPANSLIELVITNFDNGGANISAPQYANVMGTTTGSELVYNNTAINSTEGPNGMTLSGSQSVTSLPTSESQPADGIRLDNRRILQDRSRRVLRLAMRVRVRVRGRWLSGRDDYARVDDGRHNRRLTLRIAPAENGSVMRTGRSDAGIRSNSL